MSQILPRFDFRIDFAAAQDLGNMRKEQEDVYLLAPELALFAVADGLGGHAAGEIAAGLAVNTVREVIASPHSQRTADAYLTRPGLKTRRRMLEQLKYAVEQAHALVRRAALEEPSRRGMGSTLDVVWLARDRAFVAHVGDGRAYLARPTTVLQLTQDHVQGEALKANGVVHPTTRHTRGFERLVNAIGPVALLKVDTLLVDVARGDRLLLCSDGVHGPIRDEARLSQLLRQGSAEQACHNLVATACASGRDNATAVVIEVGESLVKRPPEDRGLAADDVERARVSVLLVGLPLGVALEALAAAVEIELDVGATVPRVVANDLVAYVVLDGVLRCGETRCVGAGALLFAESLVGVWNEAQLPVVERRARLLRLRSDDFHEVCRGNPALGMQLYQRIATHLARAAIGEKPLIPTPTNPPPPSEDE